jgi:hypothetical protein
MTCDDVIAQKIAACEAAGAYYMRQPGFLYSLVDTTEEVIASIFHWISWTYDASRTIYVCNLNYLDCDCEEVLLLTMEFAAPPATIDLFGYAFLPNSSACAGGCKEQIATLIAQAVASGWTIKGGGVIVQKTSSEYPCYRFDLPVIKVALLVDTGSSFYYIGCDCSRGSITSNYAKYGYLEYDSCDCFDIRELVLTYPEAFAIEDVSFGEDTIYHYFNTDAGSDYYDDFISYNHSYQGDAWYCDYTTMYIVVDNTKVGYSNSNPMTMWTFGVAGNPRFNFGYKSIEFVGKIQPFTTIEDNRAIWGANTSLEWKGNTILWDYSEDQEWEWDIASYYSKSEAESALAEYESSHAPINIEMTSFGPIDQATPEASFGPTYSHHLVSGNVVYSSADNKWHVIASHYESNVKRVYGLNYIPTSKGFLVNPSQSFNRCITIEGTENVPQGVSALDPHSSVTKCIEEKGMGGCQTKEWWDVIIGQYSEDEEESA